MRIGVVVHPRRDAAGPVAQLARWARERDIELVGLRSDHQLIRGAFSLRDEEDLCAGTDLLISLGGDGTILRAMRLAAPCDVPVLPVNLGRLGFLAEVEIEELAPALEDLAEGRWFVEPRVAVQLEPHGIVAYNDVALTRMPGEGPAALAVEVEGDPLAEYRADALVVATPTGSTAHSFSAGGPILSPRLLGLVVTPVAPHTTFDRSVVIHPEESVVIRALARSATLLVEADGQTAGKLSPGDCVRAHVHHRSALLVRMNGTSFYARARRKLQLPGALPQ